MLASGLVVDNSAVPDGNAAKWLTDAEMDTFSLSKRDQTFSISGLSLAAGDQITFVWFGDVAGGQVQKNMFSAVDNFSLRTDSGATLLYEEDFQAVGETALAAVGPDADYPAPQGWRMKVNNEDESSDLTVANTATWGGIYQGYYTPGVLTPPLLYVEDDATVYLHGRDSFAVPVQLNPTATRSRRRPSCWTTTTGA